MKPSKWILLSVLAVSLTLTGVSCSRTEDQSSQTVSDAKPYPLDTCLVCGMKLGEMGQPYTFVYQGQEIKVCGESEKAIFDKDPAKYLAKLADANEPTSP